MGARPSLGAAAGKLALTDPAADPGQLPRCNIERADANDDASIDGRDIQTFVDLLLP